MKSDTRTQSQHNAYWLFQEMIAEEMRNHGVTMREVMEAIDIPPTKESLHPVFKVILSKMFNKESTKDMKRWEMNECLEVYMNVLAQKGIVVHFPDRDKQRLLESFQL